MTPNWTNSTNVARTPNSRGASRHQRTNPRTIARAQRRRAASTKLVEAMFDTPGLGETLYRQFSAVAHGQPEGLTSQVLEGTEAREHGVDVARAGLSPMDAVALASGAVLGYRAAFARKIECYGWDSAPLEHRHARDGRRTQAGLERRAARQGEGDQGRSLAGDGLEPATSLRCESKTGAHRRIPANSSAGQGVSRITANRPERLRPRDGHAADTLSRAFKLWPTAPILRSISAPEAAD
jgi:hypothetical protein